MSVAGNGINAGNAELIHYTIDYNSISSRINRCRSLKSASLKALTSRWSLEESMPCLQSSGDLAPRVDHVR